MAPLYLHYQRDPDEAVNALYFRLLIDLPLPDLEAAAINAMQRLVFMPKVAELRAIIQGNEEERAALAWARAHTAALRGYGTVRPLDFGDMVLHATVTAMGGWSQLYALGNRAAEGVDAAVARKEFLQLYVAFIHRGVPPETPPALHMNRDLTGLDAPLKMSALGEAKPGRKALPPATAKKEEKLIPAPPEFLAAVGALEDKMAVPSKVRKAIPDREPTPEEVAEHERRKKAKIDEARARGVI